MSEEKAVARFENKLVHIGVVVRDMDKAVARLESLGFGPFKPYDFESLPELKGDLLFRGKPYQGEVKVFVGKFGSCELELLQPVSGDSPQGEFLENRGEGVQHIAFAMDNYDEEVARFTDSGVEVLHSARHVTGSGCAYLDIGVGGLIIELEDLG